MFGAGPSLATSLLVIASLVTCSAASGLDPLSNVEYGIIIVDQPLPARDGQVVPMTDARGRQLSCLIPKEASNLGSDEQVGSAATSPWGLLSALEDKCFTKEDGWWSLRVCYKRGIHQLHEEGGKTVAQILLGQYVEEEARMSQAGQGAAAYLSHSYVLGDKCDLTGQPRTVEVRYACGHTHTVIQDSHEEPSCQYLVRMQTPLLCAHPDFVAKVEKAIIPITCTTRSGTQGPAHTPRATPDEVLPASAGHAASEAASQAASQPSPA